MRSEDEEGKIDSKAALENSQPPASTIKQDAAILLTSTILNVATTISMFVAIGHQDLGTGLARQRSTLFVIPVI